MKLGLISFTKAFVLATGLSLGSVAVAFAGTPASAPATTYFPIALGPQATIPLSSWYQNPPTGAVTLGGVPFNLTNFTLLFQGQSTAITTSVQRANAAYLLLNSAWTFAQYTGQTAGKVRLTFSDGTIQETPLVVGGNIREWEFGLNWTANTLTNPSATNVWTGLAAPGMGGATAGIDMLRIPISTSATLTGVTVTNTAAFSTPWITLRGLTVSDPAVTVSDPAVNDEDEDEDGDDGDDAALAMHHDAAAKHDDRPAPGAKAADDRHDGVGHAAEKAETERPDDH